MTNVEAIVLAGGNGFRMGKLTRNEQKCLLLKDEEPIILQVMRNLHKAFGSVDLKIGVSYFKDDVREFVRRNLPSKYMTAEFIPHGKGAESWVAYKSMQPYVKGPYFLATSGDVIVNPDIYTATLQAVTDGLAIYLNFSPETQIADTHAMGLVEGGSLRDFKKCPPEEIVPDGWLRDMTIYGGNRDFWKILDRYPHAGSSITLSVIDALKRGEQIGAIVSGDWIHIAYPEDLCA